MASDSEDIVVQAQQLHEEFRALTDMVTGVEGMGVTAAGMELRVFHQMLRMGHRLLVMFFETRAAQRPPTPVAPDGTQLNECHLRPRAYLSVFGKIRFLRHRFFVPGQAAVSPLDAELSLPARCYSPLLSDWVEHEVTDAAYEHGAETIQRILGIDLSKNALETLVAEDAQDVETFYTQKPVPAVTQEGPILVVQADGAGVRLVGTEPSKRTGHRNSKREAVVTGVYTVGRHVRSARSMADALLKEAEDSPEPALRPVRPAPVGKELWATMDGKNAAFQRLQRRVDQRDGPHIQARVALTDGDDALQERMT